MTQLEKQLLAAIEAAQEHLEYTGYGDSWEREWALHGLEKQIADAIAATRTCPDKTTNPLSFIYELVNLCAKHGAVIFPRTDGKHQILSVQIDRLWLDYKRIDGTEAEIWRQPE